MQILSHKYKGRKIELTVMRDEEKETISIKSALDIDFDHVNEYMRKNKLGHMKVVKQKGGMYGKSRNGKIRRSFAWS
jgi:hypothetical protein